MSLINIEKTVTLDVYDHDTTPSVIKTIQMDTGTRAVYAVVQNSRQGYDIGQNAEVKLTVLRPDKTRVQITGQTFGYSGTDGTIYGAKAELSDVALAVKGNLKAQFKITSGEQELRTEIFAINNGEALDAGDGDWAGDLDGHNLDEMAESIETLETSVGTLQTDVGTVKEELEEYEDIFTSDLDESISAWLDAHPEATTTIQDGAVTEPKLADALKNKILNPYVTPEMFGAAGNGSTDDTQAVQAALDSEANCCLVGRYKVTDTLVWNKRGKEGKNVFGVTNIRFSQQCHLVFDLADRTKPCIELQSDGFTLQNVSVKGADLRTQTFIKTNNSAVDIDMSILNCSIYNFDTVVDITGRGLDISNSLIVGCSVIAKIAWSGESDGVYHDDVTGQRAYNFCNNRIHSVGVANSPLIQIASGNLYGFRFINNNIDRGYSSLLHAYGNAQNWLISGNTFNGVMGYGSNLIFIGIDGAVEQVTISNNNFTQVETNTLTARILSIGGAVNGLVFMGNSFGEIINTMLIYFGQNIKNSILSNNLLLKNALMSTVRGLFTTASTLTMENTSICNNVVGEISGANGNTYNQYILRCSGALTLRNVKMMGNIRPLASVLSNVKDYSIGTSAIEHCLFDWEL